MSGNIARNMIQQSRNNGIINYPTQLHLVGRFYKNSIMTQGTMNLKNFKILLSYFFENLHALFENFMSISYFSC
jgi:hypothetical protein